MAFSEICSCEGDSFRPLLDKETLELALAELKAASDTKKLAAKNTSYEFLKASFLRKAAKLDLAINFLKLEMKGVQDGERSRSLTSD